MTQEKRKKQLDLNATLRMLNDAQNFALGVFGESGAELAFVRETSEGCLAVVKTADTLVTIDSNGKIDDHPNIQIRKR